MNQRQNRNDINYTESIFTFINFLKYMKTCSFIKICLIVPSFPWAFGPYQKQMYSLAKKFSDHGHTVYWWSTSLNFAFSTPEAVSSKFIRKKFGDGHKHSINDSFIKYISIKRSSRFIRFSDINKIVAQHRFDNALVLQDIDNLVRDENLDIPTTMWYPCHFNQVPEVDLYTLRGFTSVAALSSSVVIPHTNKVYIPHSVKLSSKVNDIHMPIFSSDKFIILVQASNYETFDRKGFMQMFNAFSMFKSRVSNAHMYVHSPSATNIFPEYQGNTQFDLSRGMPLQYIKTLFNISETDVTIDETVYNSSVVAFMKKNANVCLHTSKVEGFGMNIVECQKAGTPVVTTKFGAMDDNTCFGISVPPGAYSFHIRGIVAEPDSIGTADALYKIYTNAFEQSEERCFNWIKKTFSLSVITKKFEETFRTYIVSPVFDTPVLLLNKVEDYNFYNASVAHQWLVCCGYDSFFFDTIPQYVKKNDVIIIRKNGNYNGFAVKMYLLMNIQISTIDLKSSLSIILGADHVIKTVYNI